MEILELLTSTAVSPGDNFTEFVILLMGQPKYELVTFRDNCPTYLHGDLGAADLDGRFPRGQRLGRQVVE